MGWPDGYHADGNYMSTIYHSNLMCNKTFFLNNIIYGPYYSIKGDTLHINSNSGVSHLNLSAYLKGEISNNNISFIGLAGKNVEIDSNHLNDLHIGYASYITITNNVIDSDLTINFTDYLVMKKKYNFKL